MANNSNFNNIRISCTFPSSTYSKCLDIMCLCASEHMRTIVRMCILVASWLNFNKEFVTSINSPASCPVQARVSLVSLRLKNGSLCPPPRINTIMDSDRVLVMHAGKVVEFDAPAALLQNDQSLFSRLVGGEE